MINPNNLRLLGIFLSSAFLILIPGIWFLRYLKTINSIRQKKNSYFNRIYNIDHLGVIMDGNRRWARTRNIDLKKAYMEGGKKLQDVVSLCIESNISTLTIYVLTIDNLKKRTRDEIDSIFSIINKFMEDEVEWFKRKKIAVNVIGDFSYVDPDIREKIERFCERTPKEGLLKLNILFSYDYLNDIEYGVKEILKDIKSGKINEEDLNEKTILKYMRSKEIEPVDLIIRTGNSERISGFLPLQSAYSEMVYFSCMWPDVTKEMFLSVFEDFSTKTRNFGK